jgi:hypothetical protein
MLPVSLDLVLEKWSNRGEHLARPRLHLQWKGVGHGLAESESFAYADQEQTSSLTAASKNSISRMAQSSAYFLLFLTKLQPFTSQT